jgi:hypothetical protein
MAGAYICAMITILTLYQGAVMDSMPILLLAGLPLFMMLLCIYVAWDIRRED